MKFRNLIITFTFLFLIVSSLPAQIKLRPSNNYWDKSSKNIPIQFSQLSRNRKLAVVGDTLYMLNARNQTIWTWTTGGAPLTDFPIIDSHGIIYAIGFDITWVALNSKNGEKLWQGTANGKAVYSQIELYKKDMYLVITNMTSYRENDSVFGITTKDNISLCKGNSILWTTEIPANAEIKVKNGKVFTFYKQKKQIVIKRIKIPRHLEKPIGKVDERSDYN
ncbi:MAG: hypothetical protein ABJA66_10820 [Actinomycetota bacterium]